MVRDLSRSRAILVGNSTYRPDSGIPNLHAASTCVAAMTRLLTSSLCGWPEDRIEPLVDIAAPHELARRIARAVKDVQGVVLLYYVGHGLRTTKGQLALALGDSDGDPVLLSHTAILYENIAEILRGCSAETKLVLLDCCHAELGNKANYVFQSADLTEAYPVDGLYFIGASKTHEKAKAPLDGPLTYFTQNLIDTIEQGVPNRPEFLRLEQIFVSLRDRMVRRGLPEPVESGTRGARQFPFARNAAPAEEHIDYEAAYKLLIQQIPAANTKGDPTALPLATPGSKHSSWASEEGEPTTHIAESQRLDERRDTGSDLKGNNRPANVESREVLLANAAGTIKALPSQRQVEEWLRQGRYYRDEVQHWKEASKWLAQAANAGNPEAAKELQELQDKMG